MRGLCVCGQSRTGVADAHLKGEYAGGRLKPRAIENNIRSWLLQLSVLRHAVHLIFANAVAKHCKIERNPPVNGISTCFRVRLKHLRTFSLQPTTRSPLWINKQRPFSSADGGSRYCALDRGFVAREPLQIPLSQHNRLTEDLDEEADGRCEYFNREGSIEEVRVITFSLLFVCIPFRLSVVCRQHGHLS